MSGTAGDGSTRRGSSQLRSAKALEWLAKLFSIRAEVAGKESVELDGSARSVLAALVAPLEGDEPQASQAAEAALVISAFILADNRVLNVWDASAGDLEPNDRLAGDRTVGDKLCRQLLAPKNIPSTQGPFQSSTYRNGYNAKQARNDSLGKFIGWLAATDRTVGDVQRFASAVVDTLLDKASAVPPIPELAASRFTYIAFRQARERLLSRPSGGAFEQYLLAGLINQEVAQGSQGLHATTKNVGANDRAAGALGDVEVRRGHRPIKSYEVTAADWRSKLDQVSTVAKSGLSETTIVAAGIYGVSSDDMADLVGPVVDRLGVDISVVELTALMDVVASRISRHGRAAAFAFVHDCLVKWHRRQPHLAKHLIFVLSDLNLVVGSEEPPNDESRTLVLDPAAGSGEFIHNVRALLADQGSKSHVTLADALRKVASEIENRRTSD
jgi:hypothetical protein